MDYMFRHPAQGGICIHNKYVTATEDPEVLLQMRLAAYYQAQIAESDENIASETGTRQKLTFQEKLEAVAAESDAELKAVSAPRGAKYARYTAEQVEALERVYSRCPKPTLKQRQQLILDCPTLRSVDQNQIKVWFQNRRCRERQRKESSRLQVLNGQLNAMNSMLIDENSQLRQQLAQLMHENNVLRQHLNNNVAINNIINNSVAVSDVHYHNHVLSNSSSGTSASPPSHLSLALEH